MRRDCRLTVYQRELCLRARHVRVAVQDARHTVCRPTCMRHGGLRDEGFAHVDLGRALHVGVAIDTLAAEFRGEGSGEAFSDVFPERGNLADLLEEDDGGVGRVAVNTDT